MGKGAIKRLQLPLCTGTVRWTSRRNIIVDFNGRIPSYVIAVCKLKIKIPFTCTFTKGRFIKENFKNSWCVYSFPALRLTVIDIAMYVKIITLSNSKNLN